MGANRRFDPLSGRHVLVSTGRLSRPWQGQIEPAAKVRAPAHDPGCHLCPGNVRASGARNPDYRGIFAFENDFPALSPDAGEDAEAQDALFQVSPARGRARVLCYSDDHGASLTTLGEAGTRMLIDAWCEEVETLSADFAHVQIFENRGADDGRVQPPPARPDLGDRLCARTRSRPRMAGSGGGSRNAARRCSPRSRRARPAGSARWRRTRAGWRSCLIGRCWPFETLVLPRFPVARLPDLGASERDDLARLLGDLMARYDALFSAPMPYSMGWHGAPGHDPAPWWTLHAHVYPPLLRSASVRKHMVGFELLAEAQRDLTPEEAAARLRAAR